MYLDILEKRIQPPYCPDLYRFNFDENEFGKGEAEFVANIRVLQGTIQENFPR
jgi:serum/glucocorticoid-regulated kinase 2